MSPADPGADAVRGRAARLATIVAVPAALVAGLASLWLFGGAGREDPAATVPTRPATAPVPMPARPLGAQAATVCRAVLAGLPEAIRDAHRRPVTAGAEQNAAYGDPPLTLACGTTQPSIAATDDVYLLEGVCWHPRPAGSGTAWTTVDRQVPITVTVADAAGSAQWVIVFSGPVSAADPALDPPRPGCR